MCLRKSWRRFLKESHSLRSKMIFIYIFASIVPILLVSTISFYYYSANLASKINDLIEYNLIHTKRNIETSIDAYKRVLYRLASETEIMESIDSFNQRTEIEGVIAQRKLREKFAAFSFSNPGIRTIAFINSDLEVVFYDKRLDTLSGSIWSDEKLNERIYNKITIGEMVIFEPYSIKQFQLSKTSGLLNIGVPIRDFTRKETKGAIVIGIDEDVIADICNPRHNDNKKIINTYSFIVSDHGQIISFLEKDLIGANIYDGVDQLSNSDKTDAYKHLIRESTLFRDRPILINKLRLSDYGWTIVNVVDEMDIFYDLNFFRTILIVLGIFIIGFSLTVILLYSEQFTQSVKKVIDAMERVQKGDLSTQVRLDSKDEIEVIGQKLNMMVKTINELMDKVREQGIRINDVTRKRKEAEIRALEAQINPHFLYNTLDCINWMAIDKKEHEISYMIKNLAGILRYTISGINTIVKIEEEIKWLKQYIYLQQVRFDNCFEYEIDVVENTYHYKTYKLLLQPFVENAIIHGFDSWKKGGKLLIRISIIGSSHMVFHIEDNGNGINEEKLGIINSNINSNSDIIEENESIGIFNVYNRIRMYYGDKAKLEIFSERGKGTIVLLYIPLIKSVQ